MGLGLEIGNYPGQESIIFLAMPSSTLIGNIWDCKLDQQAVVITFAQINASVGK